MISLADGADNPASLNATKERGQTIAGVMLKQVTRLATQPGSAADLATLPAADRQRMVLNYAALLGKGAAHDLGDDAYKFAAPPKAEGMIGKAAELLAREAAADPQFAPAAAAQVESLLAAGFLTDSQAANIAAKLPGLEASSSACAPPVAPPRPRTPSLLLPPTLPLHRRRWLPPRRLPRCPPAWQM